MSLCDTQSDPGCCVGWCIVSTQGHEAIWGRLLGLFQVMSPLTFPVWQFDVWCGVVWCALIPHQFPLTTDDKSLFMYSYI